MLIDPLNIFQDIKEELLKDCINIQVYAFGSRVSGISTSKKWDFDIIVIHESDLIQPSSFKELFNERFKDDVDENGKKIKVDVWTIHKNKFDNFKNNTKNFVNVCML